MRCEMGVPIGDELGGESKPRVDVAVVHLCDLGSRNCGEAGEEDCAPRASVVYDGQYGIVASTLGQPCD